jgi:hypothetical protein
MSNEFESADRELQLRKTNANLSAQIIKYKNRAEEMVQAAYRGAMDAQMLLGGIPLTVPPAKDKRRSKAEVALWHMTDWQGAKVTSSYNSDVMVERVLKFTDKAERITNIQRSDHPVKHGVIMFGGDMVEGLFNFPTQPYEIDATIFEQFVRVSSLLVRVVRRGLEIYENLTVIAEWGNHGRIGNKAQSVPKADNIDRMCYEMARQLLEHETRLTWQDCPEDIQRVEIGNYRALLMHGDEVGRAGFASPTAWIQAGNRWGNGAYPWTFQDIYLGHFHRDATEPLANGLGAIYWTGSTESDNKYARDNLAASGIPSQRLHFIDPDKGRVTAKYQIWLDS